MRSSRWRYLALLPCLLTAFSPAGAVPCQAGGEAPSDWTSGLLPGELAAQYQVYHLATGPQGQGVRWVVTPRGDSAALYTAGPPQLAAASYTVWVKLATGGAATATLGAQWYDNSWEWGQAETLREGVVAQVSSGQGKARPRRVGLRLSGLTPGQKYALDWGGLSGYLALEASPAAPAPPRPPASGALPAAAVILDTETLPAAYAPPADAPLPRLYRVPVAAAFSPYGRGDDTWLGPNRYDYRDLDARLAALATWDPKGQALLQVSLDSPPWWEALHPEALAPFPKTAPELCAERKLTHASWYSPAWRQAARQALQNLIKHVEAGPWAGHVLGYELDSGRAGRWVPWHQAAQFQETSPAAQAAFRAWLQRKYGSLAALRVAWGQPRQPLPDSPEVKAGYIFTQWAQIMIPSATYLLDPKSPSLYDPSGQEDLADYQQFLGEYTAEVILDLIKAGREVSDPARLWGACYGHLLWWPEDDWPPSLAGHLGLSRLLAADEVNFLVGPPGAPLTPTSAVQSIELRHKWYFEQLPGEEVDGGRFVHGGYLVPSGPPPPQAPGATPQAPEAPAGPPWALVVDQRSLAHLSPSGDLQRVTLQTQAAELQSQGWPEVWLPGDLPAARSDYAGYLLAATYYVPEELREALIRRTRPGTVLVWLYAAGALDGGFIDPSAIFRLTGLKATLLSSTGALRIEVPPGEPLFTPDADKPLLWGPLQPVQPRFVLVTGEETVGSMTGSDWPGLGLRWDQGALTVYSAAPGVPGEVLRRLAAEAQRKAGAQSP